MLASVLTTNLAILVLAGFIGFVDGWAPVSGPGGRAGG
jgi:hypothetical protein